jgi:CBS domain-containing protein
MRYIVCRFCGHENPTGGDACENCGAEFSEGIPESPAAFEGRLLGAKLGALARPSPPWLEPSTSALDAVERMRAEDVDVVLVGDGHRLAGLFTDRDAMLGLAGPGPGPALRDVMSADPVVLRADDTVAVAIHKMAVAGVRHVALADETGVIAVVAARDVFRHLATRLDEPVAAAIGAGDDSVSVSQGSGATARAGEDTDPPTRSAADGSRPARPAVPTE